LGAENWHSKSIKGEVKHSIDKDKIFLWCPERGKYAEGENYIFGADKCLALSWYEKKRKTTQKKVFWLKRVKENEIPGGGDPEKKP